MQEKSALSKSESGMTDYGYEYTKLMAEPVTAVAKLIKATWNWITWPMTEPSIVD